MNCVSISTFFEPYDWFPFLPFAHLPSTLATFHVGLLTRKWRFLSGKGRSRRFMFSTPKNVEELRRLVESDVPVLAFAFKRRAAEAWAPEHTQAHGQLLPFTRGRRRVEAVYVHGTFPSPP